MTTLLEDLQAVLAPLAPVGGAWYQVNEAQPPALPYIAYMRVVSSANVPLTGGNSDLQNTRVQIDIYAQRISDAESINRALPAAMNAGPWAAVVDLTQQDLYEPDTRLHRILREFSIWATN